MAAEAEAAIAKGQSRAAAAEQQIAVARARLVEAEGVYRDVLGTLTAQFNTLRARVQAAEATADQGGVQAARRQTEATLSAQQALMERLKQLEARRSSTADLAATKDSGMVRTQPCCA